MPVLLLTFFLTFSLSLFGMWGAEHLPARFDIVGDFIGLQVTHNQGIAFGLQIPSPWQERLIGLALLLVALAAFLQQDTRDRSLAYGLILGGAMGNLVDRMIDGLVTDYIQIGTFPFFNLADSAICLGVGLLVWNMYWDR